MDLKKIMYVFLLFFAITACEDQITSHCEIDDSANKNAMPAQFSAIQQTIFNTKCISCHSGSIPSGGLDLSVNIAYSELINKNLVIPGNSFSSSLFDRLNTSDQNKVMPPSGKIAQMLIDSVAAWIDRGAQND